MQLQGIVLNANTEKRELLGKDGVKRTSNISHVLLQVGDVKKGDKIEILNVRSFDATWALPAIGTVWVTPPVRKYENYSGTVSEVLVNG